MRAIRYHEYGDPDVLQVDDVERPDPEQGEVLVRVRAASLNPLDTLYIQGVLGGDEEGAFDGATLPSTVGTDLAGVVQSVHESVTAFEPGDRVFGTGLADRDAATFADFAVAPADHLATIPAGVPFETAAAGAHVGGTAWRTIVTFGDAGPADSVLVHGGSGGVGHMAVQLAAVSGARVVATAGSERARDAIREFGADAAIDYARSDLGDAIREAAEGPIDLILDPHTGEYLDLDVDLAANGGTITHINGAFPAIPHPDGTRTKELTIQGVAMHNTPDVGAVMRDLATLFESGDLVPHVDRTVDPTDVVDAYRALSADHIVGKIVLTF